MTGGRAGVEGEEALALAPGVDVEVARGVARGVVEPVLLLLLEVLPPLFLELPASSAFFLPLYFLELLGLAIVAV